MSERTNEGVVQRSQLLGLFQNTACKVQGHEKEHVLFTLERM